VRCETNRIGQGRRTHESESRLLPCGEGGVSATGRNAFALDEQQSCQLTVTRLLVSAAKRYRQLPRRGQAAKAQTPGERHARGAAVASKCCAVHFVDDTWERCRECRRPTRQHGWRAYDQSVLRDLDRDVLRRPRPTSLPRPPCAGQRQGSDRLARGDREQPSTPPAAVRTRLAPAQVRHSSRSSRSDDWPDARHH
jgi:hypothetical protein